MPPAGNANFAWVQHFLYHLKPGGLAGFVLAKGALTSKSSGEGDIRAQLVKEGLVECVVNLPGKLFLNTQIPASLWFVRKGGGAFAKTRPADEVLFIDTRERGELINRRTRELTPADLALVADTYHLWQAGKVMQTDEKQSLEDWEAELDRTRTAASDADGVYDARTLDTHYRDVPGFCASVPTSLIAELDYVLTPGRYVGLAEEEDDFDFAERMAGLKKEFEKLVVEGRRLDGVILGNLEEMI